ncbi:MAG: hypothetical protein NZ853_07755 [Leptospiraceae bacterium]|nr:hypothetical protein [Leptospiraceae bacterium]MDW7975670.1 hypothetical protein [Leptospiraceae bacterium]
MEITTNYLLNSARNFIRRRELTTKEAQDKSIVENTTHHKKILEIFENLKSIQNELTKEQVRFQYLSGNFEQIHENLKYNNESLFPELKDKFNREELLEKTKKRIEDLTLTLKKLEIEQENFFAMNFISPNDINLSELNVSISNLKAERVSRLTRNQFLG